MSSIALPQKITYQSTDQANQDIISVEPLYPGYGTTIGNALRRVLLSSLPGAAVIGVKIKGADHEFTALPNIKEDVLEIVLNLKKLRLQFHGDEPFAKLELDVRGEKQVKASDFKKNSQITIVNPDLPIATITDMGGSLEMELTIGRGLGYETVERRETKNKEIGYIEVDAIYSPVLAVGLKVENIRVGKMTNWDKLILTITTDGTITPKEAFNNSVLILIEQFQSLINLQNKFEEEDIENNNQAESLEVQENNQLNNENELESEVNESPAKKKGRKAKEEKEDIEVKE